MIYDDIIAYLSGEYRKGKTYQQIADERGLSFGYIHDLIHGRNKVERMSLETFFKLFPSAQIELAPARVPDDPAAAAAARSEYQDLRDKYQDLRDKYQDLRDKYQDLRESVPPHVRDERSLNPYRISVPSTSSSSNK